MLDLPDVKQVTIENLQRQTTLPWAQKHLDRFQDASKVVNISAQLKMQRKLDAEKKSKKARDEMVLNKQIEMQDIRIQIAETKARKGRLENKINQELKRQNKLKEHQAEIESLEEAQRLRQEYLKKEELRRFIEKQEQMSANIETLAAMKLKKMVKESRERCEILQDNHKLRDLHEQLIEKLCQGKIEGDEFAEKEKLIIEQARAKKTEQALDFDLDQLLK